jgi:hypothetical protein
LSVCALNFLHCVFHLSTFPHVSKSILHLIFVSKCVLRSSTLSFISFLLICLPFSLRLQIRSRSIRSKVTARF